MENKNEGLLKIIKNFPEELRTTLGFEDHEIDINEVTPLCCDYYPMEYPKEKMEKMENQTMPLLSALTIEGFIEHLQNKYATECYRDPITHDNEVIAKQKIDYDIVKYCEYLLTAGKINREFFGEFMSFLKTVITFESQAKKYYTE